MTIPFLVQLASVAQKGLRISSISENFLVFVFAKEGTKEHRVEDVKKAISSKATLVLSMPKKINKHT